MTDDDELIFHEDGAPERPKASPTALSWKMLVVDDEPEVHAITRLVLSDFTFRGRRAQFFSAYSAAEAITILEAEKDIALILLDVVMETDDAGLKLVHHIREVMGNRYVRIILRTGQPGQAPERHVVLEYDINDYKAKTQLTAQQLFTSTVSALRSYEDLITIDNNRRGLEKIIEASSSLSKNRSMKLFAAGILTQLSVIVGAGPDAILCIQRGDIQRHDPDGLYILAGSGRFEDTINERLEPLVSPEVGEIIATCLRQRRHIFGTDHCAMYIRTLTERENVVYLKSERPLNELDERLLGLFCDKITVGFEKIYLYEQLLKAQEVTVATLADIAETAQVDIDKVNEISVENRAESLFISTLSERTARLLHVRREFREAIDGSFLELIGLASMLHDVGNITLPDHILHKPGPLSESERLLMQQHTVRGNALLMRGSRMVDGQNYLEMGAEIALFHHENYDGSGYPDGLAGNAIPISARIVAVADTFDALTSDRSYRPRWSRDRAIEEIRAQRGRRFDPIVVDAFLTVLNTMESDKR